MHWILRGSAYFLIGLMFAGIIGVMGLSLWLPFHLAAVTVAHPWYLLLLYPTLLIWKYIYYRI